MKIWSTWAKTAVRVIKSALEEGRAKGLTGRDLERYVSDQYPFGERAHHPYKVWLACVRRLVKGPGLGPAREWAKDRRIARLAADWPGMTPAQRQHFGCEAKGGPELDVVEQVVAEAMKGGE